MDEFSNNNQFNLPDLPEIPKSQIDFGEKLRPNKPNYISPKVNYTSDELYRKRLQERDDAVFYVDRDRPSAGLAAGLRRGRSGAAFGPQRDGHS